MAVNKICLLDPSYNSYKANLHGHTVISDGEFTPEEYISQYKARGYSIVALTDHGRYRYHSALNTEDFVCLAAYEDDIYPEPVGDPLIDREKKTYHLNVYDTRPESRPAGYHPAFAPEDALYYDKGAINRWIAESNQDELLICYNHPAWSMQDYRDYTGLQGLWAMEVYNHGCETEGMYGMAPQVYDEMLRDGQRLYCVATDDNHNRFPIGSPFNDSFGGFTVFNLPKLNYREVARGMTEGRFYASMGPLIHELSIEDGVLHLQCSPVHRICLFTESRRTKILAADPGALLTRADFQLDSEVYIRIQIRDEAGRYAFSRAYFLDELKK